MAKLIFINPDGFQDVMEIGVGGGCNDKSKEIWNETIDGVLDPKLLSLVGGLVRRGGRVFFDESTKAKNDAIVVGIEDAKKQEAAEKDARVAMLKNVASAKSLEDLQATLSAMCVELGYYPQQYFQVSFHLPFTTPKRVKFLWISLGASLLVSVGVNLIFKLL